MTLKSLNKKFAVLSLSLLAAATLASAGGGIHSALAADTTNQVSNGEVKIYAESAAGNTSATQNNGTGTDDEGVTNNQDTANSNNSAQAGNQGSTKNDGTTQSVTSENGLMANVKFSATKFTGSGAPTGTDDAGFPTTADKIVTSNASGLADFTGLTDGYWKFSQVTTVNGITTVNDFIVYVNTTDSAAGTVNVYPKLDMSKSAGLGDVATTNADDNHNGTTSNDIAAPNSNTDLSDQTLTNTDKNSGNDNLSNGTWSNTNTDNENTTTAGARDTVNWNVNSVFDSSQTTNTDGSVTGTYGTYIVKDQLPNNLVDSSSVNTDTVVVNVNDGTGKKVGTLTPTADYTVANDGKGGISVTLTAAGQAKVAGMLGNADGALNVVIPSTVKDGVYGQATDSATTTITNAYGADLSTTDAVKSTLNVGALDFTKNNTGDSAGTALANATFVLVKADNMADAQAYVEANASYFVNDASKVTNQTAPEAGTNASFVTDANGKFVTTTTNSDGLGTFTGLNLVDTNTDTSNNTNYFAVEVQAPTGYQLPTASNGSNVFGAENASTAPAASDNYIKNIKPFALPFTGGEGVIGVLIIALGITGAAIVIKRNKRSDEEVVVK